MSDDDPILDALARLEAGQAGILERLNGLDLGQDSFRAEMHARFDRLDTKVDKIAADLAHLPPRVATL